MERLCRFAWVLPVLWMLTLGCGSHSAEPSAPGRQPQAAPPDRQSTGDSPKRHPNGYLLAAQEKLPTIKVWLGAHEMVAEVASQPTQIATGMMHRTAMDENEGMLFVFTRPHRAAFYMRNTLIPLSCAYIDPDGVIREIHDMKPRDETPIEAGTDQVQFVLETRQGWFERHGIKPGTVMRTERGGLRQTFFR